MPERIYYVEYIRRLFEIGERRRLSMFSKACTMTETLNAIITPMDELYNTMHDILVGRSLSEARGVQLDTIGKIVGQPREAVNTDLFPWFTPDDEGLGPDGTSRLWQTGVPLFGTYPADDVTYLGLIVAKIYKNHVKFCSIPEIIQFVKLLYGYDISIGKPDIAEIQLIVPPDMPQSVRLTLTSEVNDERSNHQYFLPVPSGTKLNPVVLDFTPPEQEILWL